MFCQFYQQFKTVLITLTVYLNLTPALLIKLNGKFPMTIKKYLEYSANYNIITVSMNTVKISEEYI